MILHAMPEKDQVEIPFTTLPATNEEILATEFQFSWTCSRKEYA
jgi:hypothetical protein